MKIQTGITMSCDRMTFADGTVMYKYVLMCEGNATEYGSTFEIVYSRTLFAEGTPIQFVKVGGKAKIIH